jgi:hypothetical protein
MELDEKIQVLVAIYAEYQKPLPNIPKSINYETVSLDKLVFNSAIASLENEGYINGSVLLGGINLLIPEIVKIKKTGITSKGINFVQEMMGIDEMLNKNQKAEAVKKYAGKCG